MKESEKLRKNIAWLKEYRYESVNFYDELTRLEKELRKEECRELSVGDGATLNYYTDRHACTVIHKTKKMIVLQRDKATLSKGFKPDFVVGGFAATCLNNNEQNWEYERNPDGQTYKAYWSEKKGCFVVDKWLTVSVGRHEFYDYNF